ncbi:holo-ACP synthase [Brevibacillus fulvus]|uniref:Holo-[acyl-carrier-protein] synthase n=1 Tax=Brevibacillus fulvus TaxID=1125967 RepID=A0A939BRI3_9BACL|nr:holo-ACP synthase [Brevibacillus fulvus]MBM7589652.1 holo-[acyl-carrier protein] synthase [Brevibacillus fulvus]
MIYGLGVDIQGVTQISCMIERLGERFLERVFTENEIAYCRKHLKAAQHFAARWAVKEAFFKALGTGVANGYRLLDVELEHLPSGQPYLVFYGKVREDCARFRLQPYVSLSHSEDYAVGQVILISSQTRN